MLKFPSKMLIYAEKNMRYAHFAEICRKCNNMRNMRQSHIRIKLACLVNTHVSQKLLRHNNIDQFLTPAASGGKRLCVGLVSVFRPPVCLSRQLIAGKRYLTAPESSSGQRLTLRSEGRRSTDACQTYITVRLCSKFVAI